jgi:AbiTii
VLGGKSGSERLRDWATRELKGYYGQDDLPDYRVISAPLMIDGIAGNYQIKRQSFPPSGLPDFAREHISEKVELRDGVGAIEALLQHAEINLSPPMSSDLMRYMNAQSDEPYQHIERLYWGVSHSAVRGVLDQIRTSLTQLVAELRANMSGEPVERDTRQAAIRLADRGVREIDIAACSGVASSKLRLAPRPPLRRDLTLAATLGQLLFHRLISASISSSPARSSADGVCAARASATVAVERYGSSRRSRAKFPGSRSASSSSRSVTTRRPRRVGSFRPRRQP